MKGIGNSTHVTPKFWRFRFIDNMEKAHARESIISSEQVVPSCMTLWYKFDAFYFGVSRVSMYVQW